MAGVGFTIPWYATGFRGDAFEEALDEIAPVALRYGATELLGLPLPRRPLQVPAARHCSRTTRDFDRYWYGPEFVDFRADYSSWYQVPVALRTRCARRHASRRPRGRRQRRDAASALLERAIVSPASLSCSQ